MLSHSGLTYPTREHRILGICARWILLACGVQVLLWYQLVVVGLGSGVFLCGNVDSCASP
jgi:hypothetical protein